MRRTRDPKRAAADAPDVNRQRQIADVSRDRTVFSSSTVVVLFGDDDNDDHCGDDNDDHCGNDDNDDHCAVCQN